MSDPADTTYTCTKCGLSVWNMSMCPACGAPTDKPGGSMIAKAVVAAATRRIAIFSQDEFVKRVNALGKKPFAKKTKEERAAEEVESQTLEKMKPPADAERDPEAVYETHQSIGADAVLVLSKKMRRCAAQRRIEQLEVNLLSLEAQFPVTRCERTLEQPKKRIETVADFEAAFLGRPH